MFLLDETRNIAFCIECKYQDVSGTVDEKIPYALADMKSMHLPGCIVYAGKGFSEGVLHLLQASDIATYCLPEMKELAPSEDTIELDMMLAVHFQWWDILIKGKAPFSRDHLLL